MKGLTGKKWRLLSGKQIKRRGKGTELGEEIEIEVEVEIEQGKVRGIVRGIVREVVLMKMKMMGNVEVRKGD